MSCYDFSIKLNRANVLLFKIKIYISLKTLRSYISAIFETYLSHSSLVWSQELVNGLQFYKENDLRIINFQPRNFHTSFLLKKSSILKFQDKTCFQNILFLSTIINNLSPSVSNTWFSFFSDQNNYETSVSRLGNFIKPSDKTNRYGKYSVIATAAAFRNEIKQRLENVLLKDLSPIKVKTVVTVTFILNFANFNLLWKNICEFPSF